MAMALPTEQPGFYSHSAILGWAVLAPSQHDDYPHWEELDFSSRDTQCSWVRLTSSFPAACPEHLPGVMVESGNVEAWLGDPIPHQPLRGTLRRAVQAGL